MSGVNNDITVPGQGAFVVFLQVVCDAGCEFNREDNLNTGNYSYFYSTCDIIDKDSLGLILSYKKSLLNSNTILKSLKDKNVSFYFGVTGYDLEYGFLDSNGKISYKIGSFYTDSSFLRGLGNKCLSGISGMLSKTNLKDVSRLRKVVPILRDMFDGHSGVTTIVDESRVMVSFGSNIFKETDLDSDKLNNFLGRWLASKNMYHRFHTNVILSTGTVSFVLKLRNDTVIRLT